MKTRLPRPLLTVQVAAAIATAALGQQKPAAPLSFEVTSVKPNTTEDMRNMRVQATGGRFTATNVPLALLVQNAYNLPFQSMRLVGLPEWAFRERFDVQAKAADHVFPAELGSNERNERMRAL